MRDTSDLDATSELSRAFVAILRLVPLQLNAAEQRIAGVVGVAAQAVPHCDSAALTVSRRLGPIEVLAATDEVGTRLAGAQSEVGTGPCLDAITNDDIVESIDFTRETRWRTWIEQALAHSPARSTGTTSVSR